MTESSGGFRRSPLCVQRMYSCRSPCVRYGLDTLSCIPNTGSVGFISGHFMLEFTKIKFLKHPWYTTATPDQHWCCSLHCCSSIVLLDVGHCVNMTKPFNMQFNHCIKWEIGATKNERFKTSCLHPNTFRSN